MPSTVFLDADNVGDVDALLEDAGRLGVDTEFMREKTYFPQLCLVQVAARDHIYCIDPLDAPDMEAAWNALMPTTWVVHSGRQDIEVVFHAADRMPAGLFDTQVAAGLLGHPPQLGYAALVSTLFDIRLDKSHTRADWSRRPLAPELIEYAAEDVAHLLPAADKLGEQLESLGRLEWAREDSASLLDVALYRPDPADAVRRLKGARRLSGKALGIASRLAQWRELEAEKRNRPRQWILGDAALLELATAAPTGRSALSKIEGLPAGAIRRIGDELLSIVATGGQAESGGAPRQRPDARHQSKLTAMQQAVATVAGGLRVAPEIVASRKELTAMLLGERRLRPLAGWRRSLVGDQLLQIAED